jgi:hypothetical protein
MKLLLDNQKMAEEFFENSRLLGIMAPVNDYHFCWLLNRSMELDFRVNSDIEIQLTKKKRNYFFTLYEYHEPVSALEHYIYNNRYDGEYLLPEFRHFDFLWLMKGDPVNEDFLLEKINSLRRLDAVHLVTELTNEKIKNKEHLVF